MSWQSRVLMRTSRIVIKPSLNALISVYGMLIAAGPPGTAKARWIQTMVASSDHLAYPLRAVRGSTVEVLPGWPRIEKVSGPGELDENAAVVFFHGGGLVAGGFNSHRRLLSRLSANAHVPVYSVEYRLLIEHEFADAVRDGIAAYRAILAAGIDPAKVVLGGDSGGAAVALGSAIAIRDGGLPLPAGVVIMSPWVDFDPTEKLADPRAKQDAAIPIAGAWPMSGGRLMAEHVLARSVSEARAVSPINHDLSRLPPFLIHAADTEVLAIDALALHDRLLDSGVRSGLKLWPGQIHVFQLAADVVPEGRTSLEELGGFIRRMTGDQNDNRCEIGAAT
ncbi:alpha/beta hydrolase [Antrihabitans stalactiti]|uniref:Alpha/beta hydrolase n=1 Tax=Antrihabitans stalactiti TaxID=2584121 RepID=A0A848K6S9_9NOCA|nr:alpha/beta hydrolase [Antrihabitans stalactiti]NMN94725.1 alpha/beta hydrolase [Antrihabitans stalactiti]